MAKTRANAQISTSSAKLNNGFVARLKKKNKKESSSKSTEPQPKIESFPSAVKLQSKNEKAKIAKLPTVEELLKLCRPMSIRLTRIKPNQTNEIPDAKSKYCSHFKCIVVILFICAFKINKKKRIQFLY